MITYQTENFTDNIEGVEALTYAHWEEIAGYKDKIALSPDWDKYRDLDKAGILRLMTVRKDGVMVGYSIFVVFPLLHYKEHSAAANDVIFLLPEYRGVCGYRFLKFCHEQMVKTASRVTWHVKAAHDWGRMLAHLGYKLEEHMYGLCTL